MVKSRSSGEVSTYYVKKAKVLHMVKSRSSLIESSRVDRTAATVPDESNAMMLSGRSVASTDLGGQLSLAPVLSRAQKDGRLQSNFVTMNPINPKPKTLNPKS